MTSEQDDPRHRHEHTNNNRAPPVEHEPQHPTAQASRPHLGNYVLSYTSKRCPASSPPLSPASPRPTPVHSSSRSICAEPRSRFYRVKGFSLVSMAMQCDVRTQ